MRRPVVGTAIDCGIREISFSDRGLRVHGDRTVQG
jgi:hypothetical protein